MPTGKKQYVSSVYQIVAIPQYYPVQTPVQTVETVQPVRTVQTVQPAQNTQPVQPVQPYLPRPRFQQTQISAQNVGNRGYQKHYAPRQSNYNYRAPNPNDPNAQWATTRMGRVVDKRSSRCHSCQQIGHWATDAVCPNNPNNPNNQLSIEQKYQNQEAMIQSLQAQINRLTVGTSKGNKQKSQNETPLNSYSPAGGPGQ